MTIYQHRNFGGWYQCLLFRNTECTNLNPWWVGSGSRVSGANSYDTCIRLYEGQNCEGTSLEIKPGGFYHSNLVILDFEDKARSVSACIRNTTNSNLQCYVKKLFSRSIDSSQISTASDNFLGSIDQLASISAGLISIKLSGVSQIYEGLKFIVKLFETEQNIVEALVDAKVERGLARNAASQMSAKMRAIHNRLKIVLDARSPTIDKRVELANAMHTCEEIQGLFADKSFALSRNKLVSSPYLVAFSAVYLTVAKLTYEMRPEVRPNLEIEIANLAELNKEYKIQSLRERSGKIVGLNKVVEDGLVCKPGIVEGEVSARTECFIYIKCPIYDRVSDKCEECLERVKTSIEKDIEQFFRSVILNLEKFPN